MSNPSQADCTSFVRLGAAPCIEVFGGDESASTQRILLQDELQLHLVLRGRLDVCSNGVAFPAGVGTVLQLPARQMHALTAGALGYSFIAFHLDEEVPTPSGHDAPEAVSARDVACVSAPAELVALGSSALARIAAGTTATANVEELLFRTVGALVTSIRAAPAFPAASGPATRVNSIQRALVYLRDHFMREITLRELAAAAGLSKFYFVRLFAAVVGITPHRYQLLLRIARARGLLRQGAEIADVAQRTGFFDQSHFTACFREVVGVTPGRYRLHPVKGGAAARTPGVSPMRARLAKLPGARAAVLNAPDLARPAP
jgi:AraC-like DNA-binding protein